MKVAADSRQFSTKPAVVLQFTSPVRDEAPVPVGYQSIDDVVAEFERDPSMRAELKRARTWVADSVLGNKPVTLRTLRLKRGLSQAQLAEEIGTKQPHIARMESGNADLLLETCRRLAGALGVDLNTLDQALLRQRS